MTSESLDRALGDSERALLDSSALIAFHSPHESAHAPARHLLDRIESDTDPLRGYISVVSVTELLVRPLRTSQARFTYMHVFLTEFPNLAVLPMDLAVSMQAASLRATMGLSVPDAVVVASGLLAGCDAIVSNDARWKHRGEHLFSRFRWIYLGDHI